MHTNNKIVFADEHERGQFLGWVRLLIDDLNDFAASAGILVALSQRSDDAELAARFNQEPSTWTSIFSALELSTFVALGRIHDDGKNAILKKIVSRLGKASALAVHDKHFKDARSEHQKLLKIVKRVRDEVYAHTSERARIVSVFAFDSLEWSDVVAYWRSMAIAAEQLEQAMFLGEYGPRFDPNGIDLAIARSNLMFDRLLGRP